MINDNIIDLKLKITYFSQMAIQLDTNSDHWFIYQTDHLLTLGDTLQPLTMALIAQLKPAFLQEHTLGKLNGQTIHCAELSPTHLLPYAITAVPLRKALESLPPDWYAIAVKAYAIINLNKNNHFCGRCGAMTEHKLNTFERVCTVCNLVFYPRISPSMIVLIHKGDDILMARSPHFTPGAYGLIAGFVEAGESIEEAVHREVKEEVGLRIKSLRYFGSQAWPFPDSLMVGFIAEYADGEIHIDKNEIEIADWYHFSSLPGRPSNRVSIASKLIDHFIASRTADRGEK